ncbi:type III secretion system cytoplasmic ring protein SctQ [Acidovorax sp. NCPPB 2350]|nr:type III secretion system cytoplasmic ring protein SctQ [Acidovorax sp. NCPPB 2350]
MNTLVQTPTMTDDLATSLPGVEPGEAHVARVAFDRRFTRWASQLCQQDDGRVAVALPEARSDAVALEFSCVHGRLEASVRLSAWPALEMAARLTNAALARDVAEALLSAPLAALGPALPGLTLSGITLRPAMRAPLEWVCGGIRVGLHAVDAGVATRLRAGLARFGQADGRTLSGLRLPGRARIATRHLPAADLASLQPGDVVLCGSLSPSSHRRLCHLSFGLGTTMQIPAELDLDSAEVALGATPHANDDDAAWNTPSMQTAPGTRGPASQAPTDDGLADGSDDYADTELPLAHIGGLSVPVAFEIDTARIRLDDLAALGPGSVVPLDMPARDATVRLVCHDQVVGSGRLVVIGESLGVRIERMALDTSASSGPTP